MVKIDGVLETENLLKDNYPVYLGYFYVCDGKVCSSPIGPASVSDLKVKLGVKEVRSCDLASRGFFDNSP